MGAGGKIKFMTVTEEDRFVSRCGSGVDEGRRVLRTGDGSVDTTCVGLIDSWEVVVIYPGVR